MGAKAVASGRATSPELESNDPSSSGGFVLVLLLLPAHVKLVNYIPATWYLCGGRCLRLDAKSSRRNH